VSFDRLLAGTAYDPRYGQSPAAFAMGRVFESRCAGPTQSFAPLLGALADVGLDTGRGGIEVFPDSLGDNTRAARTRKRIKRICEGDASVVLLYQAALEFTFAGLRSLIRPDAVVIVPVNGRLHVVELKGFRMRSGKYPADKIAGALEQTAVYQIALRRIVADLGFDERLVADEVVVVCAKNRGMTPIATVHNNAQRVATLELRLRRAADALQAAPASGPVLAGLTKDSSPADRLAAFEELADTHGTSYCPKCLEVCGAAAYCREAAADDPARLGQTRLLDPAGSLRQADGWSHGQPVDDPADVPVAERLVSVRGLLQAARADAGLAPVAPPRRRARQAHGVDRGRAAS
jgi:hypothetical protein